MKKSFSLHTALFISLLAAYSCQKVEMESLDDFSVTASQQTYKLGDTALFNLTGKADIVVFFSGEPGRRYEHRARTTAMGSPKLIFQSNMTQGVLTNPDSLRLYISTNLKGYDSASVVNASWTDITSRNKKWPQTLSSTFVTSDSIDLSDFNNADSINIAFRATGGKYATSAQRRWQIQNLRLVNLLPDGTQGVLFSTFANTGWVQANLKNNPAPNMSSTAANFHAWNVGESGVNALNSKLIISNTACNSNGIPIRTAYPVTFDPGTSVNADENDDWLITAAVNLKSVSPDIGATIKRAVDVTLQTYRYRFAAAGTYTVTFVAQNQRLDKIAEVVKQVTITVTP